MKKKVEHGHDNALTEQLLLVTQERDDLNKAQIH